ncbi:MAG: PEGA domain-containing protein [Planctomycetota bacterium]
MSACLAALSTMATGCIWVSGHSQVQVTSEPMGAEILVDGQKTGQFTPSILELDGYGGSDKLVELQLEGHEPERRVLTQRSTTEVRRWTDGTDYRVYSTPLWWNLGDFFFPFDFKYTYVPRDLHVVLYPIGEAPVGSARDESTADEFDEALSNDSASGPAGRQP